MKAILENYDVLFFLAAITCVSVLMKLISSLLYRKLLRDSNQMGTTRNRWMKSMMAKFEAYYKLRISVHNVENFVDRYLYHYHFLGLSLQTWEYIGYYASAVIVACTALAYLAAGYYRLASEWFLIMGFAVLSLLIVQGMTELLLNNHRRKKLFRIQLIDYMENTMRARLENEYFHQEAKQQYQMEYFEEEEDGETKKEHQSVESKKDVPMETKEREEKNTTEDVETIPAVELQWKSRELKALLASILEEMQLDRDIARKQQALANETDTERAQLFDEILKEYI